MKIIKRNSDDVVLFIGDDLQLDALGAYGKGWIAKFVNSALGTLLEGGTPPAVFVGGCYTFIGGVWAVLPAAQAQVDAAVAAQAAVDNDLTLKADANASIQAETVVAELKAMNWNNYNTVWWPAKGAAFKDGVLKYLLWVICKRVL